MTLRSVVHSWARLGTLVVLSAACSAESPQDKTGEGTLPDTAAPAGVPVLAPALSETAAAKDSALSKDAASSLGSSCKDDRCPSGLTCLHYEGIAGAAVKLSSCEIKCSKGATCPSGLGCTTIADGPGGVCRPTSPRAPSTTPTAPSSAAPLCSKDDECGWDNFCVAHECKAGGLRTGECDKSLPLPGDCRCLAHQCAIVAPPPAAPNATSCKADTDCNWNDPCVPKVCWSGPTPSHGCKKASLPPGECRCLDGLCATLTKPKE